MQTHDVRKYLTPPQREPARSARVTALVLGLAALGYGGITLLQHAGPSPTSASRFIVDHQMVNPAPPADSVGSQAASGAAPAAEQPSFMPKPATRDFDYFPGHYVNQATKNEEPIATF